MNKRDSIQDDDDSAPSEEQKSHPSSYTGLVATQSALEDMSRKRKLEHKARLSELNNISSTLRNEEELSAEERQRQMSMIYSRRKRVRQNQRIDELTETCVSLRQENERLQKDDLHLESLLSKAGGSVQASGASNEVTYQQHAHPFTFPSSSNQFNRNFPLVHGPFDSTGFEFPQNIPSQAAVASVTSGARAASANTQWAGHPLQSTLAWQGTPHQSIGPPFQHQQVAQHLHTFNLPNSSLSPTRLEHAAYAVGGTLPIQLALPIQSGVASSGMNHRTSAPSSQPVDPPLSNASVDILALLEQARKRGGNAE
ncbi:hypothetical protein MPSEU_000862000 [Mayamaea pseudoterrestris]|nr:hypothetical protein MPSEU_000862000 [Mayamaea pseudoterrestris]